MDSTRSTTHGGWKGPNDISASPEPRPSEQALSERDDDVSSLEPKLCHCDKWLNGGSNELTYRCVKVEGTVKNPVNVCTENYGGKVNQCPSDSQAQACTGVPPPSPPPRRRRRRRCRRPRLAAARRRRRPPPGSAGSGGVDGENRDARRRVPGEERIAS